MTGTATISTPIARSSRVVRWFHRRVAQPLAPGGERYQPERPSHLAGIQLTDAEVTEFNGIYQQLTGTTLTPEVAREKAVALMLFVHALVRPTTTTRNEDRTDGPV
jgi:hypothetical protein